MNLSVAFWYHPGVALRVHSERENLDWKVRRVWVPIAVRPMGPRQIEGSVGRYAGAGMLVSPIFALLFAIPTMLVLLPLRFARLASWRVEAVAYPWGRRGPKTVMGWRVKAGPRAGAPCMTWRLRSSEVTRTR